jgi:hypothetical protein
MFASPKSAVKKAKLKQANSMFLYKLQYFFSETEKFK